MTRGETRRVLGFVLLVMACGGGCMSMPYQSQRVQDLSWAGLDEHTRDRLDGLADPRPNDPEPTPLNGGLLRVLDTALLDYRYGPTADTRMSERSFEQLKSLDGIEYVLGSSLVINDDPAARFSNEPPPTPVDLVQLMRDHPGDKPTDLVLVYTAGHTAKTIDLTLGIGQVLLLGLSPTLAASGKAQVEAALIDARTGYVYAVTRGEGDGHAIGNYWSREGTKAKAASHAVEEALDEVVDQFDAAWPELKSAYN